MPVPRVSSNMLTVLFACVFSLVVKVTALDCYTPNGTSRNEMLGYPALSLYAPCNAGAKHSMCCKWGASITSGKDSCVHNNMFCQSGDLLWRESCTDPTWQDPACQRLFINGTGYDGEATHNSTTDSNQIVTDVQITFCDDGETYCYGYNNRACCQAKQGVYLDVNGNQVATNPNATTSTTTTSSATGTMSSTSGVAEPTLSASSPTPVASSSGGLSTGAKAGIGVGIAVVVLAAIAIAVFLLMRRKKTQNQNVVAYETPVMGGDSPAQPRYEAPGHLTSAEKYGGNVYSERAELEGTGHAQR